MAKLTTAQLLAEKRAEVAELEAQLISEVTVGSIAYVLSEGHHGDIPVGTLVRIAEISRDYDDDDSRMFRCEYLDGSDWDRFNAGELEFVTRETARERLYAEVERTLTEAFGEPRP